LRHFLIVAGSIITHLGAAAWLPWHFTVCGIVAYLILIKVESEVPKKK
jgi:hypothetical protein